MSNSYRPCYILLAAFFVFGIAQTLLPRKPSLFHPPSTHLPEKQSRNHCTFPISNLPSTLDPRMAPDATSGLILRQIYEGLTRLNKDNKGELALAESYEISKDRKTYTFHLRESYWSNGARLVAADFVNSWLSLLDPSFPSPNAYHLFCIEGAQELKEGRGTKDAFAAYAVDDHTIQITLKEPDATFLELLAFDIFYPVYTQPSDQNLPASDRHISNGPFSLISELGFGKDVILKKNPHFWDKESVSLQRLDFCLIQDPATALELFAQKQIDWVGSPLTTIPLDVQLGAHNQSTAGDGLNIQSIEDSFSYWITLNCETSPFKVKETRQAIALALKPIDFSKALGKGRIETDVPLPSFLRNKELITDHSSTPSDEEIRALFQKGCEKQNIDPSTIPHLTYVYNPTDTHRLVAQLIKEQLEKVLPIHVVLQSMEWQSMQKELKFGSFTMARNGWRAQIPNALNILEIFETENVSSLQPRMHNFSRWSHEKYDSLLELIRQQPQGEKRNLLVEQCCQVLKEELPVIPLFFDPLVYCSNPKLKNVLLTELGRIDFSRAYLDNSN